MTKFEKLTQDLADLHRRAFPKGGGYSPHANNQLLHLMDANSDAIVEALNHYVAAAKTSDELHCAAILMAGEARIEAGLK